MTRRLRGFVRPEEGIVRVGLLSEKNALLTLKFERSATCCSRGGDGDGNYISDKKNKSASREAYERGIGSRPRRSKTREKFHCLPSAKYRSSRIPLQRTRDSKLPDAHSRCCNVACALHKAKCHIAYKEDKNILTQRKRRDAAVQRAELLGELQKYMDLFAVQEQIVAELLRENVFLAHRARLQREALGMPANDARGICSEHWFNDHSRAADVARLKHMAVEDKIVVIRHMIDNLEEAERAVSADNVALAMFIDTRGKLARQLVWL